MMKANYILIKKQRNKFSGLENITPYKLCLWSVSKHYSVNETKEIASNGTVYDFSIKYRYIFHLHDYLINNYKMIFRLVKLVSGSV